MDSTLLQKFANNNTVKVQAQILADAEKVKASAPQKTTIKAVDAMNKVISAADAELTATLTMLETRDIERKEAIDRAISTRATAIGEAQRDYASVTSRIANDKVSDEMKEYATGACVETRTLRNERALENARGAIAYANDKLIDGYYSAEGKYVLFD